MLSQLVPCSQALPGHPCPALSPPPALGERDSTAAHSGQGPVPVKADCPRVGGATCIMGGALLVLREGGDCEPRAYKHAVNISHSELKYKVSYFKCSILSKRISGSRHRRASHQLLTVVCGARGLKGPRGGEWLQAAPSACPPPGWPGGGRVSPPRPPCSHAEGTGGVVRP